MENQEDITYLINMVKQINETTMLLSQNQTLLIEQYKSLNQKYDSLDKKVERLDQKYDALDKKVDILDQKYDALDKKVDKYYEENRKEHFEIKNILAHMQNDIKDLRTDIDTVYDLEKDSRKKIRHLL